MIKSRWRFSLNGVILLDQGDYMTSHPSFPVAADVQETRFVGGQWGKARGRGNKMRTFQWSRVLSFSTVEECQTRQLQLPQIFLTGKTDDLLIEVEDGGSTLVSDFALTSVNASHRADIVPTDLLLEFEGIGGEESVISSGGFSEVWESDDETTWNGFDSTKWQRF